MGDGRLKHSRAVAGGTAAASTNKWFHLRRVVSVDRDRGVTVETLECGHTMHARSDMIGEYDAVRRRCRECPKETVKCEACDGTGTVANERDVRYRCEACNGDGRFVARDHVGRSEPGSVPCTPTTQGAPRTNERARSRCWPSVT